MSDTINNFFLPDCRPCSNTLDTLLAQNEVFNQDTGNWKYQGTVSEWWLQGHEYECQSSSLLLCRKLSNLEVYICKSAQMIIEVTSKENIWNNYLHHSFTGLICSLREHNTAKSHCTFVNFRTDLVSEWQTKRIKNRNATKDDYFLRMTQVSPYLDLIFAKWFLIPASCTFHASFLRFSTRQCISGKACCSLQN